MITRIENEAVCFTRLEDVRHREKGKALDGGVKKGLQSNLIAQFIGLRITSSICPNHEAKGLIETAGNTIGAIPDHRSVYCPNRKDALKSARSSMHFNPGKSSIHREKKSCCNGSRGGLEFMPKNNQRVEELQRQIAELKKHWPAHSVPPALMQQLDDLEEALEKALRVNDSSMDEDQAVTDSHHEKK